MDDEKQTKVRILSIDDDERLQGVVREFLENYDYSVHTMQSGKGLAAEIERIKPDLLLLDVMMPGDDGFAVLRALRETSRIPVIMLTACGEDTDRIIGLEIGADDYLAKPFNPRELLARIKAVLRRSSAWGEGGSAGGQEPPESAPGIIREGSFILDAKRQTLARHEKSVNLSTTEYRILHAFMSHAGEVLARDRILSLVFGDDHYVCDRNIDVYISRIRGILRKLGEEESRIRTAWGTGYSWVKED